MEEILRQILTELQSLNSRVGNLESRIDNLEAGQAELNRKFDSVIEQTADLLEFRTETLKRLDNIENGLRFVASELGTQKLDIELLKKRPV